MKYPHLLMRTLERSVSLFLASVIVGTTTTLGTAPALRAAFQYQGMNLGTKDGTAIRLRKTDTTKDRSDYRRAVEICSLYIQQGKKDIIKPDLFDRATIDLYLKNPPVSNRAPDDDRSEPISTSDYVKPKKDVLSTREISDEERKTLQQYVKVGKCWHVPKFSAGFYDLCLQLIQGKEAKRTTGYESDIVKIRTDVRNVRKAASSAPVAYPETDARRR